MQIMHCANGIACLPAPRRAAATAAASVIRLINDPDIRPVKRVLELCVIQFTDCSLQIVPSVKLDHSQYTSALSVHICVCWLYN